MKFEHFEYRVHEGKYADLYFDTTGLAKIRLFATREVIKKYYPNKNGYIFINRIPVNFARLLYKMVYPKIDLSDKIVVRIGPSYDISYLYALTRKEWMHHMKTKKKIIKNPLNGECHIGKKSAMYYDKNF